MKVIGKINSSTYICEVDHYELEKYMNKYFDKMDKLSVGDCIDLGTGYDFKLDVKSMLSSHKEILEKSSKVIKTITNGIKFLSINEPIEGK